MEKPSFDSNAKFSSSTVGLDEGVKYYAVIAGSSLNENATTLDNKNILLKTIPVKGTDAAAIKSSDWVERVAGSRCLVGAGIATAEQKEAAMKAQDVFVVSWESGQKRSGVRTVNGKETAYEYTQKVWSAKRYDEGAE